MDKLAELVYKYSVREHIRKELELKYSKRIDYLVGANNELARELNQCETDLLKYKLIADKKLI
tara:strand:- start:1599 stop:1787 length:189 start_codon:yes stop_codon:yes gene_type:complete